MSELVKEERFIFCVGTEEHVLRVQQQIWGSTPWPERFRVELPASLIRDGRKCYGTTAREAVELAVEYLSSPRLRARVATVLAV